MAFLRAQNWFCRFVSFCDIGPQIYFYLLPFSLFPFPSFVSPTFGPSPDSPAVAVDRPPTVPPPAPISVPKALSRGRDSTTTTPGPLLTPSTSAARLIVAGHAAWSIYPVPIRSGCPRCLILRLSPWVRSGRRRPREPLSLGRRPPPPPVLSSSPAPDPHLFPAVSVKLIFSSRLVTSSRVCDFPPTVHPPAIATQALPFSQTRRSMTTSQTSARACCQRFSMGL